MVLGLFLLAMNVNAQHLNKLTQQEAEEGWELLFDGESMDQWRCFKKDVVQGWAITGHAMKALGLPHGQGGDIISKKEYKDFELYIEFQIGEKSNSGIFFHVKEGDEYGAVYHTGPEYQLLDDFGFPKSDPLHNTGANYDVHPPIFSQVKTLDEWNTAKIIVKGSHVEHHLNGRKVVEYEIGSDEWTELKNNSKWKNAKGYAKYDEGHIALQDHGGTCAFRNIKIKEL